MSRALNPVHLLFNNSEVQLAFTQANSFSFDPASDREFLFESVKYNFHLIVLTIASVQWDIMRLLTPLKIFILPQTGWFLQLTQNEPTCGSAWHCRCSYCALLSSWMALLRFLPHVTIFLSLFHFPGRIQLFYKPWIDWYWWWGAFSKLNKKFLFLICEGQLLIISLFFLLFSLLVRGIFGGGIQPQTLEERCSCKADVIARMEIYVDSCSVLVFPICINLFSSDYYSSACPCRYLSFYTLVCPNLIKRSSNLS